jgi:putative cell wall-binding protein
MKFVRPGIVLASAALAIVAPLSASAAATSSNIQPTTGTINGSVVNSHASPILNVCVIAETTDHVFSSFAQTLANGAFTITGVTPGTYDVFFDACGSAEVPPTEDIQPQFYNNTQDQSAATVFAVAAGSTIALSQQTLQDAGEINLTLTLPSGVTPAEIIPEITPVDNPPTRMELDNNVDGPDAQGVYSFMNLLSVGYTISYDYCPLSGGVPPCQDGIGFYKGQGAVNPTRTVVTPTPGVVQNLTGTVNVPGFPPITPPAVGGGGAAPAAVTVTVPAGGSASSDPAGTTPGASNPLIVGVSSPTAGTVTIDKTPPNTSVAHYTVLGVGATITAPPATTADPLTLTFQVFDKQLPAGSGPADLTVFRDGVAVGACTGPGATPDPCVASATTSGGVTTIVIRSSHASTWDVEAASVGRVSGIDRIATAVAVSQDSFPAGNAGAVVLARGDDYPDALVGGPLAAAKNAPLLLTEGSTLPVATATELKRVLPAGGTVYVLGGTSAVPATVASQLTALGYSVVRYSGADRYATAVAVAKALGSPTTVLLATGTNFPDALAAGPAAAHVHGAILLTNGSTVPTETATYLAGAHTTYAIGGPAAAAVPSATAILGSDRYATAAAVATKFFPSSTVVGVATGAGFPDALAGGAQLALMGAPLLLSSQASVPTSTSNYLNADHSVLTNVYVYGGTVALGTSIVGQLTAAFGS